MICQRKKKAMKLFLASPDFIHLWIIILLLLFIFVFVGMWGCICEGAVAGGNQMQLSDALDLEYRWLAAAWLTCLETNLNPLQAQYIPLHLRYHLSLQDSDLDLNYMESSSWNSQNNKMPLCKFKYKIWLEYTQLNILCDFLSWNTVYEIEIKADKINTEKEC